MASRCRGGWYSGPPTPPRFSGLMARGGWPPRSRPAPPSLPLRARGPGPDSRCKWLRRLSDDADMRVDAGVVAIQISAPPKSVKAGDSFVLTASPLDYRGGLLLGPTVQWSTSDVRVAVVTAGGWVATLGRGSVVLQASCEGATASVTHQRRGGSAQCEAHQATRTSTAKDQARSREAPSDQTPAAGALASAQISRRVGGSFCY